MPLIVAIEPVQPIIPRNMTLITASTIGPKISPKAFDMSEDVNMLATDSSFKYAAMKVIASNNKPTAMRMYATSSALSIFIFHTTYLL